MNIRSVMLLRSFFLILSLGVIIGLLIVSAASVRQTVKTVNARNQVIERADQVRFATTQNKHSNLLPQLRAEESIWNELLGNVFSYLFAGASIFLVSFINAIARFYANLWMQKRHPQG